MQTKCVREGAVISPRPHVQAGNAAREVYQIRPHLEAPQPNVVTAGCDEALPLPRHQRHAEAAAVRRLGRAELHLLALITLAPPTAS